MLTLAPLALLPSLPSKKPGVTSGETSSSGRAGALHHPLDLNCPSSFRSHLYLVCPTLERKSPLLFKMFCQAKNRVDDQLCFLPSSLDWERRHSPLQDSSSAACQHPVLILRNVASLWLEAAVKTNNRNLKLNKLY